MNLRDLNYIVALAETRHFGKAAERCSIEQPTLSMQLKKLEAELGVKLFERGNRHVLPTTITPEITARARKILQLAEEIKTIAGNENRSTTLTFKLGIFPTLAPYLLPHIIPKISGAYPQLRLFFTEEKSKELIQKLQDGELDAICIALPLNISSVSKNSLFIEPFYLATPINHPLAKLKKIAKEDLRNKSLFLLEEGHCLREQALNLCEKFGAKEQIGFRATSLETLRQMVAAGTGITLIPKLAIQNSTSISYIPFAEPFPKRTIALVWRSTHIQKQLLKGLAKLMSKTLKPIVK